jgi:DNA (cytosine-5)-methyltransferase 1
MMGLPAGWITDVPGLSRSAQLKLAGNGVVPQQGAAAFAHLLDRMDQLATVGAASRRHLSDLIADEDLAREHAEGD